MDLAYSLGFWIQVDGGWHVEAFRATATGMPDDVADAQVRSKTWG